MQILILGGTIFLGRHLVEAAVARGHTVTLFNRGQHNPELFPGVEKLRGNRDGQLQALDGRHWDAVIDTCGYVPRVVRASAELLAPTVDHYTFISTVSVYSDFSRPGVDENAPVGTLSDPSVEQVTEETYGPLKAACERVVHEVFSNRALVIRPGLIVGPHDPTDRFTYWPHRIAQGGQVLAPGHAEHPVQFIDVRDLAEWTVRMVEGKCTGVYNATGPDYMLQMGQVLEESRRVSGSDARFTWADEGFLLDKGVTPWMEIPLWIPEKENSPGFDTVNCRRAIDAGLTFRPLAETIRHTLAWDRSRPISTERRAGLKPERELELLHDWRQSQGL